MRNEKIQIDRLNNAKAAIAEAIAAKGVQVPESTKLDGYPTLISQISTSGSGGGKSIRTCRVVVGTAVAGWTENDCDYLCDGTSDEVKIQAAIDALPEDGGEIVLLDGRYVVTGIDLKNNTQLIGNGLSTQIYSDTSIGPQGVLVYAGSNCALRNISLLLETTDLGGTATAIKITGSNTEVRNVHCSGFIGNTIEITSFTAGVINNISIINNVLVGGANNLSAIKINSCTNSIISGNYIIDHEEDGISIINNMCKRLNVSNNVISNVKGYGVLVRSGSWYNIENNIIETKQSESSGIAFGGSFGNISGNTIGGDHAMANSIKMLPSSVKSFVTGNLVFVTGIVTGGKEIVVENNVVIKNQASGGGTD